MQALNFAAPQLAAGGGAGVNPMTPEAPAQADAAEIGAFVAALLAQTMVAPDATATTAVDATATLPGVAALPAARQGFAATAGMPPVLLAAALPPEARQLQTDTGAAGSGADDAAAAELEALLGDVLAARQPARGVSRAELVNGATTAAGAALRGEAFSAALAGMAETATREPAVDLAALRDGADGGALNTLQKLTEGTQFGQSLQGRAAPLPVHEPGLFAERLNQQVAVMVSQNATHARLAVNPAELGSVEVRVSVVGDEATIQLVATHAATREALEEALPRLRAAFADSGIALGDASVFSQMPERHAQAQQGGADGHGNARLPSEDLEPALEADLQPLRSVRLGLVDAFV
ncbi:MAG: flagellar hook-length control protein FliK [Gammaproteobacteria bacterium]